LAFSPLFTFAASSFFSIAYNLSMNGAQNFSNSSWRHSICWAKSKESQKCFLYNLYYSIPFSVVDPIPCPANSAFCRIRRWIPAVPHHQLFLGTMIK
jgi:hypothetical protein